MKRYAQNLSLIFVFIFLFFTRADAKEISLLTKPTDLGQRIINSLEENLSDEPIVANYKDVDDLKNSDVSYIDLNKILINKDKKTYRKYLRDFVLKENKTLVIDQSTIPKENQKEKATLMNNIFGMGIAGDFIVIKVDTDRILNLIVFPSPIIVKTGKIDENRLSEIAKYILEKPKSTREDRRLQALGQYSYSNDDEILTDPYATITIKGSLQISSPTHRNLEFYDAVWDLFLGTRRGLSDDDKSGEYFAVMVDNHGLGFLDTPFWEKHSYGSGNVPFILYIWHQSFGGYRDEMDIAVDVTTSDPNIIPKVYDYSPKNIIEKGTVRGGTSINLSSSFSKGGIAGSFGKTWQSMFSYDIDTFKMVSHFKPNTNRLEWSYDLVYIQKNGRTYTDPSSLTNWNYEGCNYSISDPGDLLPSVAKSIFLPYASAIYLIPTEIQKADNPNITVELYAKAQYVEYVDVSNGQAFCISTFPTYYSARRVPFTNKKEFIIDTSNLIIPED